MEKGYTYYQLSIIGLLGSSQGSQHVGLNPPRTFREFLFTLSQENFPFWFLSCSTIISNDALKIC